jgi:hypothetical protein
MEVTVTHKGRLILGMSVAVLLVPETVAAAKVFDVTLVACSTTGLSACVAGGGALTLQKGSLEVDDDGEVRVSIKGIEGTTAIEVQPPYTLGVLFFTVQSSGGLTGIALVGTLTTDHNGSFNGVVGSMAGPALGFFVINSAGTDLSFTNFDSGARQQFVAAVPAATVP